MARKPTTRRAKAAAKPAAKASVRKDLTPGKRISLEYLEAKPEDVRFAAVPEIYGSEIHLIVGGNDFTLIFVRQVPVTIGTMRAGAAEPSGYVHLSPATAKDLSILLAEYVAKHEEEWGEIQTAYTRKRSAEQEKNGDKA